MQLVVVAKAPAAIAVHEDRPRYYFRFGDATREADPWLITDLHLGRHRQPRFVPRIPAEYRHPKGPAEYLKGDGASDDRGFSLRVDVENDSLAHARDVRAGILGLCRQPSTRAISTALRERVSIDEKRGATLCYSQLVVFDPKRGSRDTADAIYPFDVVHYAMTERWLLPAVSPTPERLDLWWGAMFLVAAEREPSWFQVTILHGHKKRGAAQDFHVDIFPTWNERPRVAVEQEPLPPDHVRATAREMRERGRR